MDFLTFRSNALASYSIANSKGKIAGKPMSKTALENWIAKEYIRHYGEVK